MPEQSSRPVSGYQLESLVGEGGMGSVYRARDRDGRLVAIKLLRGDDRQRVKRFEREARILESLIHPTIVRYLDSGVTPTGEPFLVMEWLDGISLDDHLRNQCLTVTEALALIHRLARGLAVAHTQAIVHRDIKPSNILLCGGRLDQAKLLDFGAARWGSATRMTRAGAVIGTPAYMAPEQIRGELDVGPQADVFALGCLLYEVMTGKPAFVGAQVMAVLHCVLHGETPRLSDAVQGVPTAVDELLERTLAKSAEARPADGSALAGELERLRLRLPQVADELAAPAPASRVLALSQDEQRLVSVVVIASDKSPGRSPGTETPHGSDGPTDPVGSLGETLLESGAPEPHLQQCYASLGVRFDDFGDGSLLAILDTQRAATDRALDAVRCALTMRRYYPHRSIVVATGHIDLSKGRPLGEVMARVTELSQASPTNGQAEIVVDDITADLVNQHVAMARSDRGITLIGESSAQDMTFLGKQTPFVGRQRELATLMAALEQTIEDSEAQVVLITGAAGIGKSRLAREFIDAAQRRPGAPRIWLGSCAFSRTRSPLGLVAKIVRSLAGIDGDESPAQRRVHLQHRLAEFVAAEDVERLTIFLGQLVDAPWPHDDHVQWRAARQDPVLMGDQVTRAFTDLVLGATGAQPLVMVLEDLHWADRASLATLDAVLRNLREQPLLVVGFARPDMETMFPNLWAARDCLTMRLRPLARRAAQRYVRSVMGDAALDDDLDQLIRRAEGNPLHLEELVRSRTSGRDVSNTVLAMIKVRLESLSAPERRLLRAASVFGDRFSTGGLVALLPAGEPPEPTLHALVDEELIVRCGSMSRTDEAEYEFRHDLIRTAVYDTLTDDDRRVGHRLAGQWLQRTGGAEALILVEHFERGGVPKQAMPHLLTAATAALRANDMQGALQLVKRYLNYQPESAQLASACIVQAEAHQWQGDYEFAIARARQAMGLLSEGARAWYRAGKQLANAAGKLGERDALAQLTDTLLNSAERAAIRLDWIALGARVSGWLFLNGQNELGDSLFSRVESEYARCSEVDPVTASSIHEVKGIRRFNIDGDYAAALAEFSQVVSAYTSAGDVRNACMARVNAGTIESALGQFERAGKNLRAVIAHACALDLSSVQRHAELSLCRVLLHEGATEEALGQALAASRVFAQQGDKRLASESQIWAARASLQGADVEAAESHARAALAWSVDIPSTQAYALATLAQAQLSRGQYQDALSAAGEAMSILRTIGDVEEGESLIRLTYAEALHGNGEYAAARAALTEASAKLHARAASITDARFRRGFLDNIWENARTLQLAEIWP